MTAALAVVVRSAGSRWSQLRGKLRWSRRADVGLALVCFVIAQVEVATLGDVRDPVQMLGAALATLPIAWRQRAPLTATTVVAASWVTVHVWSGATSVPFFEFAALPVIYSLGAYTSFKPALTGFGLLLATVGVTDPRDFGFFGLQFTVLWLSGRGVRAYRLQTDQLRALARRLELERETGERLMVAQERQRMTAELHDMIADAVSIMVIQAGGAEQMIGHDPGRARAALIAVQDNGRAVIAQLQRVLSLLRSNQAPPTLEPELPAPAPVPDCWSRRLFSRALIADIVLAVFVVLLADPQTTHPELLSAIPVPVVLSAAGAFLALTIRRRVPLTALLIATATTFTALLLFGREIAFASVSAMMLAMYSVAVDTAARRAVPVAVAAVVAVCVMVQLRVGTDSAVLSAVWLGIPWFGGRRVRNYRCRAEELRTLAVRLAHEREARARLAVLDERARVARDLHDSLAHAINVMVLQAGAAEQVLLPSPDRARDAIRVVESQGRQAHDDLCRLLGLFESGTCVPRAPRPSLTQLDILIAGAGLPVDLRVCGRPAKLPAGLDISAYRIVQEGLTNILKHAGPVSSTVTLDYLTDALDIEIHNSSTTSSSPTGHRGHGLVGMRERASLYGGVLEAGPSRDGGFVVRAHLPLDTPRA